MWVRKKFESKRFFVFYEEKPHDCEAFLSVKLIRLMSRLLFCFKLIDKFAVAFSFKVFKGHKLQRCAVYAVPSAVWGFEVPSEYMSEMGITLGAANLGARHTVRHIAMLCDGVITDCLSEGRPAAGAVIFGITCKERFSCSYVNIQSPM